MTHHMGTTVRAAAAISVQGLTKRYGARTAVGDLTVEIPAGVVAGFIGPNGAGKTTTMAMLLGLVRPTSGRGTVLGRPLDEPESYLDRVGALIESPAFWPGLTGRENLRALATLGGHDPGQAGELLELVGLGDRGGDRFGRYSFGMKQRLGIAAALLGQPELLVLDEPTNGLDPVGITEMRQLIADIADGDRTVLVSSHILSELEQICDWLVVIESGAVLFQGPARSFLAGADPVLTLVPEHPTDLGALAAVTASLGLAAQRRGDRLAVPLASTAAADAGTTLAAAVNRAAFGAGIVLAELQLSRPSLEAHYLAVLDGATEHRPGPPADPSADHPSEPVLGGAPR